MPEFDNLYLDMNGIIHPCTHGDDGAVVRMTEEQMFVKIGKFVDELMKIVKPQKLLFLAVDGCAPREWTKTTIASCFRKTACASPSWSGTAA